jgi:hypothetical protein
MEDDPLQVDQPKEDRAELKGLTALEQERADIAESFKRLFGTVERGDRER